MEIPDKSTTVRMVRGSNLRCLFALAVAALGSPPLQVDGQALSLFQQCNTTSISRASSIAVDDSGVYVFGYGDPKPDIGVYTGVRKFDSRGNELWTRQLDSCCVGGASADSTGVYVLGGVLFGGGFL